MCHGTIRALRHGFANRRRIEIWLPRFGYAGGAPFHGRVAVMSTSKINTSVDDQSAFFRPERSFRIYVFTETRVRNRRNFGDPPNRGY